MPLITRANLIGVLYLENNLAPRVFAPGRIAVLKLLALQAAIALENTRLYSDLAERQTKIRRLVDANIIGIFIIAADGRIIEANDAFLQIVGYDREEIRIRPHPMDGSDAARMARLRRTKMAARIPADRDIAGVRKGIFPQGWQPRARADRRGKLRRTK